MMSQDLSGKLDQLLKAAAPRVELSKNFDSVFWSKVTARQKSPFLKRIFEDLEWLVFELPVKQAAAFVLLAFMIGGAGGASYALKHASTPLDPLAAASQPIGAHYLKITSEVSS